MASPVKEASSELDEFEERLAMGELRKGAQYLATRLLHTLNPRQTSGCVS